MLQAKTNKVSLTQSLWQRHCE